MEEADASDCPVENARPPIVDGADGRQFDVMQQGWSCLKVALQEGARQAYLATKQNPQLIVVLLPVNHFSVPPSIELIGFTEQRSRPIPGDQAMCNAGSETGKLALP